MGSADDWWAKKLGRQVPVVPAQPAPQVQFPSHQQQQQQPVPQQQMPQPPQQLPSPQQMAAMGLDEQQQHEVVVAAARNWKGGEGWRREGQNTCPSCGSTNYFSREHIGRKVNSQTGQSVAPAPICMSCGYNGRYEQFGAEDSAGYEIVGVQGDVPNPVGMKGLGRRIF